MAQAARLGDEISHGGNIVTASSTVLTDGRGAARKGDLADCNIHGLVTIVTGSATSTVDGRERARVGDVCECGAVIVTGSAKRDVR